MTATTVERPTIEDTSVDHDDDRAAIHRVIADIETGFNTNNPALSVEHFAQNGSMVTDLGEHAQGWVAVFDSQRRRLNAPPAHQLCSQCELHDVVFVRPDVAIVHKYARQADADGQLIDEDIAIIATYLLVYEDDRWWIMARHTTAVSPPDV